MKYYLFICNFLITCFCLLTSCKGGLDKIDLRNSADSGVIRIILTEQLPDSTGVLCTYRVMLPDYLKGIYSAQDSFYDYWQVNGNRVLPWFFTPETLADLFVQPAYGVDDNLYPQFKNIGFRGKTRFVSRHGCFLQLMLCDGRYLSVLPLAGPDVVAWFYVNEEGELELQVANYGTEPVTAECPVIAWALGENLNESAYRLFDNLRRDITYAETFRLRYEKCFPEMFQYLGWCTWEEYKKDISAELLFTEINKLKQVPLPVRYAIIDDGHLSFKTSDVDRSKGVLSSFFPNDKFPEGFTKLLKMREPERLRWMGVWHNFNGYWGGFSADNDFDAEVNNCLRTIERTGYVLPKNDITSIRRVYSAFLGRSADDGFDFLKLDWQAANLYMQCFSENGARGAFNTSRVVDNIAHERFNDAVINCMAMNNVVLQNTYNVNVTRTSIDYKLNNLFMAKEHLRQSYGNALYMCPTVWGDHDMFHSSDDVCGRIMALSKALSGGPVYLSDAPEKIVPQMVWPLCYQDGSLLRPLAPATVLQRTAFDCPLTSKTAYMVSAPLENDAAAVVAYNLTADSCRVEGKVCVEDYELTGTLLQPYIGRWKAPEEGLYLYDYTNKEGCRLVADFTFSIDGFADRYFLLLPIHEGWAVVGNTDKYLSPVTVSNISYGSDALSLTLHENGSIDFWMSGGTPYSDEAELSALGNGLWRATSKSAEENSQITIYKK